MVWVNLNEVVTTWPPTGGVTATVGDHVWTVDTFTELRAIATTDVDDISAIVRVGGGSAVGDGVGGDFYWDSTSSAADDGYTTILPTGHVGAGRWRLLSTNFKQTQFFYPSVRHHFLNANLIEKRVPYLDNTGGPLRVLVLGDSVIGYLAGTLSKFGSARQGSNGLGFDPFNGTGSRFGSYVTLTKSAGWVNHTADTASQELWGICGASVVGAAAETITYAPISSFPFNKFRVWYCKKSGGGTFSYAVDGGGATNVDTSNATTDLGYVEVDIGGLETGDTHSILLTVVSGSVTLYGIETWQGKGYGVQWGIANSGGSQAAQWAGKTGFLQSFIDAVLPDVIVVWLGANDAASSRTADQFAADMNTLLSSFTPPAFSSVVLTTPHWRGQDANPAVEDEAYRSLAISYREKLFGAAGDHGYSVWDLQSWWPGHDEAYVNGLYVTSDVIHPSNLGAAHMANGIFQWMPDDQTGQAGLTSANQFTKSQYVSMNSMVGVMAYSSVGVPTSYDTGMYWPAADLVGMKLSGTEIVRFGYNGGEATIITAFPTVARPVAFSSFRRGSTVTKAFDLSPNASNDAVLNTNNGTIRLQKSGTDLLVMDGLTASYVTSTYMRVNGSAGPVVRGNAVSADKGDAAATLTFGTSEHTNIWNTIITADRAVTLSTTGAVNGAKFRIVRTAAATGAFNLNVGTGPLKALTAGQWCEVEYNGTAWMLTAFGSL